MKTMRYLLVLGLMALMTMVLAACGTTRRRRRVRRRNLPLRKPLRRTTR